MRAQDATERELESYRQMLKDDPWSNPGLLDADRGEALWKEKRGPKNVSLEACDLGKGPGKVEGAFAELPRYFADADRVMDPESRLVWCMEKLQGFDRADILKRPYSKANQSGTELEALATYVANKSSGCKFAPQLEHAKEKEALALGEALFFRRQGPMDFACATCHADSGKRIRLQGLPFLGKPEEARQVVGEWPAYRVSQGTVMTMQHRIADCYWQMRLPLDRLRLGRDGRAHHAISSTRPRAARSPRPSHQALGESDHAQALRLIAAAGIALARRRLTVRAGAAARQRRRPPVEAAIKASWTKAAPDWQARLVQDETQKACSQYRNAPPKAVADAILAREKAAINYPPDGKLMGDWKKGEKLAQSGYGGRFTDYPAARRERRQLLRLPPARRARS